MFNIKTFIYSNVIFYQVAIKLKSFFILYIKRKHLFLTLVFSMSKLPQKHVENQWVKSWDMLEAKDIKF